MANTAQIHGDPWKAAIDRAIPAVVTIHSAFPYSFDMKPRLCGEATGIVVDANQAGVGLGLDTGMPGMSGMAMGDSSMSAGTAMQGMSMSDPTMSAGTAMQEMSINDQMSGSATGMNMQNSPSPKPLMPRMSMNDPMVGFMPQSSVMEPATSISSMPSMSMNTEPAGYLLVMSRRENILLVTLTNELGIF